MLITKYRAFHSFYVYKSYLMKQPNLRCLLSLQPKLFAIGNKSKLLVSTLLESNNVLTTRAFAKESSTDALLPENPAEKTLLVEIFRMLAVECGMKRYRKL